MWRGGVKVKRFFSLFCGFSLTFSRGFLLGSPSGRAVAAATERALWESCQSPLRPSGTSPRGRGKKLCI